MTKIMNKVATITAEQAAQLSGQLLNPNTFFNPVLDVNGNWVISEEQIRQTTNVNFTWVNGLLTNLREHEPQTINK